MIFVFKRIGKYYSFAGLLNLAMKKTNLPELHHFFKLITQYIMMWERSVASHTCEFYVLMPTKFQRAPSTSHCISTYIRAALRMYYGRYTVRQSAVDLSPQECRPRQCHKRLSNLDILEMD